MRPVLLILGKDLRQRLRDRSALHVAIVVPLVLASIFGLIFHNAVGGRVTFTFGLVDQDNGPAAQALVKALGPLERGGLIKLVREPTLAAGRSAADQNKVSATFVVPPGFSAAIGGGRAVTLQVLGSVDASIGAQVAQSLGQSCADRVDTARTVVASSGGKLSPATFAALRTPILISD
ncbi:MAG: ABC transporter permease, partial [Actinomycetota bacterium]|nr:ABC transporter permease [Actinomycetota bacterium]